MPMEKCKDERRDCNNLTPYYKCCALSHTDFYKFKQGNICKYPCPFYKSRVETTEEDQLRYHIPELRMT